MVLGAPDGGLCVGLTGSDRPSTSAAAEARRPLLGERSGRTVRSLPHDARYHLGYRRRCAAGAPGRPRPSQSEPPMPPAPRRPRRLTTPPRCSARACRRRFRRFRLHCVRRSCALWTRSASRTMTPSGRTRTTRTQWRIPAEASRGGHRGRHGARWPRRAPHGATTMRPTRSIARCRPRLATTARRQPRGCNSSSSTCERSPLRRQCADLIRRFGAAARKASAAHPILQPVPFHACAHAHVRSCTNVHTVCEQRTYTRVGSVVAERPRSSITRVTE